MLINSTSSSKFCSKISQGSACKQLCCLEKLVYFFSFQIDRLSFPLPYYTSRALRKMLSDFVDIDTLQMLYLTRKNFSVSLLAYAYTLALDLFA